MQNNINKWIYPILMILLVLFISSCVLNEFDKNREEIKKDPSFCDRSEGEEKDGCYAIAANMRAEPQLCYSIISEEIKAECFEEVSSKITDPKECEKFETQYERDSCYVNVATFHKDISYCDKVINQKGACFNGVAMATDDESFCISPSCFTAIAISKQDSTICSKIPEVTLMDDEELDYDLEQEEQGCYRVYGVRLSDVEMCFKVDDENIRNECFSDMAQNTNNINICENIYVMPGVRECWIDEAGREQCPIEESRGSKDKQLNETESYKLRNCYIHITLDKPNECFNIPSIKTRNECFYKIYKIKNDPQVCKNIVIEGDNEVTCEDYRQYMNKI